MDGTCCHCGRVGEIGIDLIAVTGHETGSQRPILRIECRDIPGCVARTQAKNWMRKKEDALRAKA